MEKWLYVFERKLHKSLKYVRRQIQYSFHVFIYPGKINVTELPKHGRKGELGISVLDQAI